MAEHPAQWYLGKRNDAERALAQVAAWFAEDIAGNETRITGYVFPTAFRDLVAQELVSNAKLGWPDLDAAYAFLNEGNYTWSDTPPGGTHGDRD